MIHKPHNHIGAALRDGVVALSSTTMFHDRPQMWNERRVKRSRLCGYVTCGSEADA